MPYVFNPFTASLDQTDIPAFNGEVTLGSAASPSVFFTGDPNTGLYSPGADQVALSTNGVQRINIEADGDINIDSGGVFYDATNNRLAIGTTSPSYELDVVGSIKASVQGRFSNGSIAAPAYSFDGDSDTGLYRAAVNELGFVTGASERARITSSGQLLVGTPTPPSSSVSGVQISNAITTACRFSAGSTTSAVNQIVFINGNGNVGTIVTNGSATAYNTSSDYRLKENVTAVTDGITRLQQLKPSRFNFIADPTKTVDGFLAHEVQTIVPEAITGEKDAVDDEGNPQYQGIDQSKLVPLLTAALQEAIGEIESLKVRVAALESA